MNHRNFTTYRSITLFCVLYITFSLKSLFSQETGVMPTRVPGSNSVTFDEGTSTYRFFHSGTLRYEYTVLPGNTTDGGTFYNLKAYDENNIPFLPSAYGGVSAILDGVEKFPWDDESGVTFDCISHQILGENTVEAYWQMNYGGDYIRYKLLDGH